MVNFSELQLFGKGNNNIQSDWNTTIINKPDLTTYATITNLNSLSTNSTFSINNLNATSTSLFNMMNKNNTSKSTLNASSTTESYNLNSLSTNSTLSINNLNATSTTLLNMIKLLTGSSILSSLNSLF
jgi:hypothetical protein